jgi:hypothetical protein
MNSRSEARDEIIAAIIPGLDQLAAEVMADWKVPGATVAVVQDDKLALAKAYGLRDVEANLPADTTTQFVICSITKSFTATAVALLHNEGRLDWTKPARDYLPEFRLHDPVATERVRSGTCYLIIPGCHDTTGCIYRAIARPPNCSTSCGISSSAAISAPPISTATSATTPPVS